MRILFIILGSISLALGIIGIFLPLLPTTPFLLLTAALYCKSSPRLYNWLLNQKHLGPYIRNFRKHKAIPLRAKILSVSLMWATMLYCIF
ncbi:MAG: YbaN family protein [Bacteroides sp.]|nr:YbaN family protein [Bacteroides sp.]